MKSRGINGFASAGLILLLSNSFLLSSINSVNANATSELSRPNEEYYYQMDIHTSGESALQELILTEQVYSKVSTYLKKLSVIDSLGATLPHDIINFPQVIQKQVNKVNIYPLFEPKYLLNQTENIILTYNRNEQLSEINSSRSNATRNKVSGYIIDLGEPVVGYNHSLRFEFSKTDATTLLSFNIDQSQNLKDWKSFRSGEILAQLNIKEMSSQRASIDINGYSKRYLRLNLITPNPQFTIESAELNYYLKEAKNSVWNEAKKAVYDPKEKAFIFDTSQSQTFTKLKIAMPELPSIFSGNLHSRINKNARWIKREKIRLFNTSKDGVKSLNNEVMLNRLIAGKIKITVDYQNSVIVDNKLQIRLASEPQKLAFFASGNPPYKLIVGNNGVANGLISSDSKQIIKMLRQQVGNPKTLASLGQSQKIKVAQKTIEEKIDWPKIGLWLILVLGVLLMFWMARKLLGQLSE